MARLESELTGTGLSLESLVGQVVPTLRLLVPEQVTLAQAIEAGRAFFVPATPMKVGEIMDGLIPMVRVNSISKYADDLVRRWAPLRSRFGEQWIHKVRIPEVEKLLLDLRAGVFLSESEKERIRKRKKRNGEDLELGCLYEDKTIKHFYDSWNRVFIRAQALGAWPAAAPVPTQLMEKPKADQPELDAIDPEDWEILLPHLDAEEMRWCAGIISDIRSAELERLTGDDIIWENGLPASIRLPGEKTKGKKGQRTGRTTVLLPNASVMLFLAPPPTGGPFLSRSSSEIQQRVYDKARQLGIETTHNFIRRAHDTYWYTLRNTRTECNADSSHDKRMIDGVYREPATFEEAVRFYRALPPSTPSHLVKWVYDWVEGYRRKVRGGPITMPCDSNFGHQPNGCAGRTEKNATAASDHHVEISGDNSAGSGGTKDKDTKAGGLEVSAPEAETKIDQVLPPNLSTSASIASPDRGSGQKNAELANAQSKLDSSAPSEERTKPVEECNNVLERRNRSLGTLLLMTDDPEIPTQDRHAHLTGSNENLERADNGGGLSFGSNGGSSVPAPPRGNNGRIAWARMSKEWIEQHYGGLTCGEIAKAWGVTYPAVYNRFTEKGVRIKGMGARKSMAGPVGEKDSAEHPQFGI